MSTRRLIPSLGALFVGAGHRAGAAVAAPPANTTAPTITGTPKVGETLTAQNGTWSNSPTAFQYQWQRCNTSGASCANVPGATQKTYLLTSTDGGRTMRLRVTGINAEGAVDARSAPTAVARCERRAAEHRSARDRRHPGGRGGADCRGRLVDELPDILHVPVSSAATSTRSRARTITGATGKTYGVRNADVGFRLRVEVTAKNANGSGSPSRRRPASSPRRSRSRTRGRP